MSKTAPPQSPQTAPTQTADAVPLETIAELRQRIDELQAALGLKPTDEDLRRLYERVKRIEEAMTLHVNRERPKLVYSQAPGVPRCQYAPEMRSDGMLLLKYAPRSGGQRNVQAGDSITLPTGVIVQAPPGHLVAVAQRRKHGEGFIFQNVAYLDSAKHTEIDILCSVPPKTITAHTSSRTESFVPGEVIGAAWLIAETAMPDTTKPSH